MNEKYLLAARCVAVAIALLVTWKRNKFNAFVFGSSQSQRYIHFLPDNEFRLCEFSEYEEICRHCHHQLCITQLVDVYIFSEFSLIKKINRLKIGVSPIFYPIEQNV